MLIGLGLVAAAVCFAPASSADIPSVEALSAPGSGYYWKPSAVTVGPGGAVAFKSASATVPHGVTWKGGPENPSCQGVPIDGEETAWSGSCSFAQAGAYPFVCTVHPTEMKGTITVSSTEPPSGPQPAPGESPESPLNGPPSRSLKLAKSQRGGSVRGSVGLSPASAGGKLEVVLLARRSSLSGAGGPGMRRVGRFARASVQAGRVNFAVPLKSVARIALQLREKLALTVQIVVKPPDQAALTLKRGVVLHA